MAAITFIKERVHKDGNVIMEFDIPESEKKRIVALAKKQSFTGEEILYQSKAKKNMPIRDLLIALVMHQGLANLVETIHRDGIESVKKYIPKNPVAGKKTKRKGK